MQKVNLLAILAVGFLISSNSFAGFSERKWQFEPGEEYVFDASTNPVKTGIEYACKNFDPSEASFTLSYSDPEYLNRIKIVADNNDKVSLDEKAQKFTITDVTTLDVGFPSKGAYTFKNITEKKVIGTNCDSGDFE